MNHSPAFLKLVNEVKTRVKEIPVEACLSDLKTRTDAVLIDVREESEFAAGHVKGAVAIGRGILERDIEKKFPNPDQTLYLYCGGGFRSALSADNLQKMGYRNVYSVAGGWRAFLAANVETEK